MGQIHNIEKLTDCKFLNLYIFFTVFLNFLGFFCFFYLFIINIFIKKYKTLLKKRTHFLIFYHGIKNQQKL